MRQSSVIGGARAKHHGMTFETMVDHCCEILHQQKKALIKKTPEPTRQIGAMSRGGTFTAIYTKKAQVDYKGTLKGGRAIVFDAKFSQNNAIAFDRLTPDQLCELVDHADLGAVACVLVCFKFETFYMIPIDAWLSLPDITGKKSANEKDLSPYQISELIDMLDALEACDD